MSGETILVATLAVEVLLYLSVRFGFINLN